MGLAVLGSLGMAIYRVQLAATTPAGPARCASTTSSPIATPGRRASTAATRTSTTRAAAAATAREASRADRAARPRCAT